MYVVVCTKKKLKYVVNYYSKKLFYKIRLHMYIKGILMVDFLFTATCHNSISRVLQKTVKRACNYCNELLL